MLGLVAGLERAVPSLKIMMIFYYCVSLLWPFLANVSKRTIGMRRVHGLFGGVRNLFIVQETWDDPYFLLCDSLYNGKVALYKNQNTVPTNSILALVLIKV